MMDRPQDGRLEVLVADRDEGVVHAIESALRDNGHGVRAVADSDGALAELRAAAYDLAIVDVRLRPVDGYEILRTARAAGSPVEVILMGATAAIADAVAAIKASATDFLAKPLDVSRLIEAVGDVAQRRAVMIAASRDAAAGHGLIGRSKPMVAVRDRLLTFAQSDAAVLVQGDSGTGKELAARLLHDRSARRRAPFVALNCAAFPDALVESELFGHVRGAFTGAVRDHHGRIAAAEGGTLFLDEVAELTPPAQAKLLRVLEDGSYTPVGSTRTLVADVRLVSATNQDLAQAIRAGRFREDLYYRLKVLHVRMPTLEERRSDLPQLVDHLLRRNAVGPVPRLTPRVWAALQHHAFPGNVRELDHVIRHALALSHGQDIRLEHLPEELGGGGLSATQLDSGPVALVSAIARFEREFILRALRTAGGSRARAADTLGISRKHLWHKMRIHGLTDDELDEAGAS